MIIETEPDSIQRIFAERYASVFFVTPNVLNASQLCIEIDNNRKLTHKLTKLIGPI